MGEKTAGIKKPESVRFFARFMQSASRIQVLDYLFISLLPVEIFIPCYITP
jgi:hypothetical protein